MTEKESNCYLYKIIDRDKLVYIGKSTNIDNRLNTHSVLINYFNDNDYFSCRGESYKNPRIFVVNVKDEYLLSICEITLISKYHPKYNRGDKYNSDVFINLPSLTWVPYVSPNAASAIYCMKTRKYIDPKLIGSPIQRWNILNEVNKC